VSQSPAEGERQSGSTDLECGSFDEIVKSQKRPRAVIPAKAGIQ